MPKKLNLGPILTELRETNKKTQKDVAERLGILLDTYKAYEQSRTNPPVIVLIELAKYYGINSLDEMLHLEKTGQKGIQALYSKADKRTKDIVNYILNNA
jgi:transcriptional regulator with XRE-family HTH domain